MFSISNFDVTNIIIDFNKNIGIGNNNQNNQNQTGPTGPSSGPTGPT